MKRLAGKTIINRFVIVLSNSVNRFKTFNLRSQNVYLIVWALALKRLYHFINRFGEIK